MLDTETTASPSRPVLRWHGGKWLLAPWIIEHFPPHRTYVEPYGGAASVLMRKQRAYSEVYNDLDGQAVNLFRVLRSDRAGELIDALRKTPFARAEFELAYLPIDDPVEDARRLVIRSFMGFGSDGHNPAVRTGFRSDTAKSGTTPAQDWAGYPVVLADIVERLRGVVIENRPALEVMAKHDRPDVLHYVDPPYMPETRSTKSRRGKERYHAYAHELTTEEHAEMLAFVRELQGMVILSGYPSDLYDRTLPEWRRVERRALADGARERTEVLWINPQACEQLGDGPLFARDLQGAA
ncbi:DNA adenine methylase [Hwanghaeella sp.]|uniref:DNA adenine methylase n=1 Tax=Hwanghaeella sp. TaxID=2605943 RepID=UPI003CCBB330